MILFNKSDSIATGQLHFLTLKFKICQFCNPLSCKDAQYLIGKIFIFLKLFQSLKCFIALLRWFMWAQHYPISLHKMAFWATLGACNCSLKRCLKSIQLNLVWIVWLTPNYFVWDIGWEMNNRKIGVTDNRCLLSLIRNTFLYFQLWPFVVLQPLKLQEWLVAHLKVLWKIITALLRYSIPTQSTLISIVLIYWGIQFSRV